MQKKIVITGYGWMAGYLGNALLSSDSPIKAHVVGTTSSTPIPNGVVLFGPSSFYNLAT